MQEDKKRYVKALGIRVRQLRKEKGLTVQNMCYKNCLEPSTLIRIERGLVEPKYLTLFKIAKAFGMTVSELVDF